MFVGRRIKRTAAFRATLLGQQTQVVVAALASTLFCPYVPHPMRQRPSVCLRARLIGPISSQTPMARSISLSKTVARLSVIMDRVRK